MLAIQVAVIGGVPLLKFRYSGRFGVCVVGLLAPLLTATLGQAASHDSLDEEDLFGGLTSVKSATRLQQRISDTPAAVTLIDRRMIEASGAVNIADLFKLVPGFQAYHVSANQFGVVSHGQGDAHPGRMEVTIDGRSVYQPALSSVDWSALGVSLDDINYIEVVRGPNVATQGSNAFLGAINITTYTPLEQSGSAVRTTLGALGTQEYALRHNDNIGGFNYRLSLNYHKNRGTGVGFDSDDGGSYARMEDGAEITQLHLHGLYTPTLADSLVVQLGLSDGQVGVGNTRNPAEFTDREVKAHYQNLSWERLLNPEQQLRLQLSHNRYEYHNESPILLSELFFRENESAFGGASYEDAKGTILAIIDGATGGQPDQLVDEGSETGITERYDLELQLQQEWNPALRLVAGAGVRHDRFTSLVNLGTTGAVSSTSPRLFGNLAWQFASEWTANLGAMLEHNPDPGARLSPRLGLNWHLSEQHTLRAAASRAYRMPSPMEQHLFAGLVLPSNTQMLDLDTYTPERLDPERVDALELGYRVEVAAIRSAFDLKLYVEEVEDGVAEQWAYSADPDPDWVSAEIPATDAKGQALQLVNNARWRNRGLEAQWTLQPWHHSWLMLGYAYIDTEGQYDRRQYDGGSGEREGPQNLGIRVPRHGLSLLVSHAFGDGVDVSAAWYRQTSVKWPQGSGLDPYNRLDGRVAKSFQAAGMQGSLELILQSVTGSYTEFDRNNSVDQRGFVRATLEFL